MRWTTKPSWAGDRHPIHLLDGAPHALGGATERSAAVSGQALLGGRLAETRRLVPRSQFLIPTVQGRANEPWVGGWLPVSSTQSSVLINAPISAPGDNPRAAPNKNEPMVQAGSNDPPSHSFPAMPATRVPPIRELQRMPLPTLTTVARAPLKARHGVYHHLPQDLHSWRWGESAGAAQNRPGYSMVSIVST